MEGGRRRWERRKGERERDKEREREREREEEREEEREGWRGVRSTYLGFSIRTHPRAGSVFADLQNSRKWSENGKYGEQNNGSEMYCTVKYIILYCILYYTVCCNVLKSTIQYNTIQIHHTALSTHNTTPHTDPP